ncbi:MAG: integrase arm-type DNA-binding domain-containing protein [Proteobacteria bacterium]|nr:integrase arm-type DNA-binding domain-containing protein [Pseudomonadota bacterium]
MPLTDTIIRNAKPTDKPRRMFDGGGLYLEISPKGGKWWRLKYRYHGKEKRISLGVYPDVSLKKARERREAARKLLADGVNPSDNRKAQKATQLEKAANSFGVVAREWHKKQSSTWSTRHSDGIIKRLERDVFPWLGDKAISDLTPIELLTTLRRVEERGALESAHRILGNCGQILRYAVATGRTDRDITSDLRGALPAVKTKHLSAITDPIKVGELLRAIDSYKGSMIVKCAMKLAPLVFVRPGELRQAKWEDIDLERAEWRFTVTKTNTPHIVPLSRQSIEILKDIKPLTGKGLYVFPSQRSTKRPMSDNAVLVAFRTMGIYKEEMSGHGFRAMARTLLDEELGFRPDFIEHQLAHAVKDPNGRAYNRTSHIVERKKMMQEWADYLDKLKAGAEVVFINQSLADNISH